MNEILLTISQALQLVALAPCIFVIAFLMATGRRNPDNILPLLYFMSLSCSFILPLLPIFGVNDTEHSLTAALMLGESLTAPFSFLLVMQFMQGRLPAWPFWTILALPVIGGSPFIYGAVYIDEVCFDVSDCYPTLTMRMLYNLFSVSLIFLLLIYKVSRSSDRIAASDLDRRHKYWLIISLVSLNVVLAMLDLLVLTAEVTYSNALFAGTVIRITFIYLVLTSIFRVFYELFDIQMPGASTGAVTSAHRSPEQDQAHVDRLTYLLEHERLYREMGLTRKAFAQKAGLSEAQASRIINARFRKNFNELINTYRINEAKARLSVEETAITVIAFEVGFNSIASFNRVFKELVGASPTEFRTFHRDSVTHEKPLNL